MKIIALGDSHGRTSWKNITAKDDFDIAVFIGDYFDTREGISAHDQMDNFRDLMAYKKSNSNKVILLFGNHDFHYLETSDQKYSCFEFEHQTEIRALLHQAIDENLLQMCFVWNNIIFTHAGVTKTWAAANNIDTSNIEKSINDLFRRNPDVFKFTIDRMSYDPTGDNSCQPPTWVRPNALGFNRIDNYIQVVGHTPQKRLTISPNLIFIDTLGTSGEYLQIVDGVFSAIKSFGKSKRKIQWKH